VSESQVLVFEARALDFAAVTSDNQILQKHASGEDSQVVSGPAVRRLVLNQALWQEEEDGSDSETVGPAAPCWDSPSPSTHNSVPPSPERVTKFIRPNPEVLAGMSQGERGAGGRALRAKAYWERRFAPLKRLEEASALLRAGIRNASIIAEQSLSNTGAAQASSSTTPVPTLSLLNRNTAHTQSIVVACESAGGGPRGEKEVEGPESDGGSSKSDHAEG